MIKRLRRLWPACAIAVLAMAVLWPLASSAPDGLERVLDDHGVQAGGHAAPAAMPDYQAPGVRQPATATVLAGLLGVVAVLGATFALARLLRRNAANSPAAPPAANPDCESPPNARSRLPG